ncbi:MAG: toxin-antitoxin system YwqK family antitoxin [Bacteroidia bacterium]|nr:toxin-antitoxin system YwqK family antitoxin [Bacteroidia bacterium]
MKKFCIVLLTLSSLIIQAQTVDASGKKQGYWKKKDDVTKHLVYEGEFKDDVPVGKFKYYYPNDSVRAIMHFKNGGKSAYAKLFHLNGKRMAEGRYVNKEIKDSVWTYYDETGVLISKEKFAMGKKEGASYVYFPDGNISEERHYKADLQDGVFKQYFDAKKLRAQGNYLKGQLHGHVVYYFPNGIEVAAGNYVNGFKTGPWLYKGKDGKITEKEYYVNGKPADKKTTDEFFAKYKAAETKTVSTGTVNPKNTGPKNKKK